MADTGVAVRRSELRLVLAAALGCALTRQPLPQAAFDPKTHRLGYAEIVTIRAQPRQDFAPSPSYHVRNENLERDRFAHGR
jgi:hypothetical protein